MTDRMTMNDRADALMNPAPRGLDDSDRNILRSLAHEACEAHCDDCGECLGEGVKLISVGLSGARYDDEPILTDSSGATLCGDCFHGLH